MSDIERIIARNRTEVFRHVLRGVAFASAAAISGCAMSHTYEGGSSGDGGPPPRDADVLFDIAVRDAAPLDFGGPLDVGGPLDFGIDQGPFDIGMSSWTLPCAADGVVGDLTGVPLPPGVDAFRVYAGQGQFLASRLVYSAGDFCVGGVTCPSGIGGFDFPYRIIARRGTIYEYVDVAALLPMGVASEAQAVLGALAASTIVSCHGAFPSGVVAAGAQYRVHGQSLPCGQEAGFGQVYERIVEVSGDGSVSVLQERYIGFEPSCDLLVGRLTEGSAPPRSERDAERAAGLGGYFARAAGLEDEAVGAFERLARELRAHGAPAELIAWASASAADERRHVRDMAGLAERFGGAAQPSATREHPLRPLFEVARENAVEGCVRETLGAVVAHHQAAHASDPAVRATLARIAEDETSHAALSWAIAAWAETRLAPHERASLKAARTHAIAALMPLSFRGALTDEASAAAGLPSDAVAREMVARLTRELWS